MARIFRGYMIPRTENEMNGRLRVALLPLCALTLAASPRFARGQAVDRESNTAVTVNGPAVAAGPRLQSLPVGVRARTTPVDSVQLAAFQNRAGLGQPEALMIVGGAAILIGAIIGDDAGAFFMVGGAVVGLYGLYKYLQ
jgi:hypothetical protein